MSGLTMMAPSILASSYRSWAVKGRSSRIPPEKRKAMSLGSSMTMSAPCSDLMMSSMPARKAVPGATRPRAEMSFLSFLGSALIQRYSDRLPNRRRRLQCDSAMRLRPFRNDGLRKAQLGGLGETSLGLGDGAQPAREADLGKARETRADRLSTGSRRDRDRDRQVRPRFVDSNAAGDVHENVRLTERDTRVAAQDGDDHGQAFRVDAGSDPPRHGQIRRRDERLDLEQDRSRSFQSAGHGGADLSLRPSEELGRVGDTGEAGGRHLEDSELVRGAEAVLHCAKHAMRAVAVAFELEHA